MKKVYLIFLLIFLFLQIGSSYLRAQTGPVSSGGETVGSGGKTSFSVGQIDYINASGSNGAISQGLQQPYEILVLTGIDKTNITVICNVYPNPASDFVLLSVDYSITQNMSYTIYDVQSKLIAKQNITENLNKIDLQNLANGFYLLKVYNDDKEVKSFKISKTH